MIKFSVPADNPVALRAVAVALETIADSLVEYVTVAEAVAMAEADIADNSMPAPIPGHDIPEPATLEEAGVQANQPPDDNIEPRNDGQNNEGDLADNSTPIVNYCTPPTPSAEKPYVDINAEVDSAGIPWDKRIHSRGKSVVGNGTWKIMRRPKEHADEAQWKTYIEAIKAELNATEGVKKEVRIGKEMAARTPGTTVTPSVFDGADTATTQPPIPTPPAAGNVASGVVTPTPPPVVPVTSTPPPIAFKDVIQLMTKLKLKAPEVNAVCQKYGIEKFMGLNGPDVAPEVIEAIYTELAGLAANG